MKKMFLAWFLVCSILGTGISAANGEDMKIEDGKKVKLDYTLKIDGQMVETSVGKTPLEYTQGKSEIIPGLESRLEGLIVGDERSVIVPAVEAYGEINEEAYREVPKTSLPDGFKPEAGMVLDIEAPDKSVVPAVVWEVKENSVVLNFNHPLAGKTLQFDIKILSIE
ncbi:MAG: peptidylprolyl isomerase [Candidatus Omnitrophica bacterium]|nr:peptidylprolyl isomerase [Candidatus Omnitrophota bacterium]